MPCSIDARFTEPVSIMIRFSFFTDLAGIDKGSQHSQLSLETGAVGMKVSVGCLAWYQRQGAFQAGVCFLTHWQRHGTSM